MANGFSFYEGSKTDSETTAQVTVRKGGQLVLTQAAVKMLGDEVTHAQIGYNPETRAIGIRTAEDDTKGRYLLRRQKSSKRLLVDGKRLFALHGIEIGKAHTVDAEDFGDGIIGFHLAEPAAAPSNGSSGAKSAARSKKSRSAS